MGGTQSCVQTGSNPHSMGYVLVNNSSKCLTLSDIPCACGNHRGFSTTHGKFKQDFQPLLSIAPGKSDKCWMSGREASAVNPEGWIHYNVEGGDTCVRIQFNSSGWSHGAHRIQAGIRVAAPRNISVRILEQSIEDDMPDGFRGTEVNRQFRIILTDRSSRELNFSNIAVGGSYAPQSTAEFKGSVRMNQNSLDHVPQFPTVSNPHALLHSLDVKAGGRVVTGGPCAGVAIQRVWYLLRDTLDPGSQWRKAKAPCIASDVVSWLNDHEGFRAGHLGKCILF